MYPLPLKFLLSFFLFLTALRPAAAQGVALEDVDFVHCNATNYNDNDECFRVKFPFRFDYDGQASPEPAYFNTNEIIATLTIVGNGVFDFEMTDQYYQGPGSVHYLSETQLFLWLPCESNPYYIYFSDCNDPFIDVFVIGEPGLYVQVSPYVTAAATYQDCNEDDELSSVPAALYKATPDACSSDLYLTLDGIPTGDPGGEAQLLLTLHNDGSSNVTLSELDFRIKIEDVYLDFGHSNPVFELHLLSRWLPSGKLLDTFEIYFLTTKSLRTQRFESN